MLWVEATGSSLRRSSVETRKCFCAWNVAVLLQDEAANVKQTLVTWCDDGSQHSHKPDVAVSGRQRTVPVSRHETTPGGADLFTARLRLASGRCVHDICANYVIVVFRLDLYEVQNLISLQNFIAIRVYVPVMYMSCTCECTCHVHTCIFLVH